MRACNLILLAAGFSRRFGGNKLLWDWEGKPLYRHTLDCLLELRRRNPSLHLLVVTRYGEIEAFCRENGVCCLHNPQPEEGIASSVRLGLSEAMRRWPETPALFLTADQPRLRLETLERLLTGWAESGAPLCCLSASGTLGNPCGFSPSFFPALLALKGDRGGKPILLAHREQLWLCPAEERELRDVDTREDL